MKYFQKSEINFENKIVEFIDYEIDRFKAKVIIATIMEMNTEGKLFIDHLNGANITQLSKKYNVSRSGIYRKIKSIKKMLKELLNTMEKASKLTIEDYEYILKKIK